MRTFLTESSSLAVDNPCRSLVNRTAFVCTDNVRLRHFIRSVDGLNFATPAAGVISFETGLRANRTPFEIHFQRWKDFFVRFRFSFSVCFRSSSLTFGIIGQIDIYSTSFLHKSLSFITSVNRAIFTSALSYSAKTSAIQVCFHLTFFYIGILIRRSWSQTSSVFRSEEPISWVSVPVTLLRDISPPRLSRTFIQA